MMKNYRPKNIAEFVRIVRPASYRAALTMHQENEIKQWIDRHGHYWQPGVSDMLINDRNLNRKQLDLQKEAIISMFETWPDYYWQFLVDSSTLDPPEPLIACRTLSQLEKRLNPIPPAPYLVISMAGSYNNKIYSNAISLLQEKLNVRITGLYDWDTAVAVSKKIGNVVPDGVGYFAHEVYPQMLFRYDDTWLIYGIDRDLWLKLGMDENDLVPDDATYWQTGSPMIGETTKEIYEIGGYGLNTAVRNWEKANETIEDVRVLNSNEIRIKTNRPVGEVWSALSTAFSMVSTAEEMVQEGIHDPSAIATEVVITGVQEVVSGKVAEKAVTFTLKIVFGSTGAGAFYIVTAIALDWLFGQYIDDLTEKVVQFFREDFIPLMNQYSLGLQESHERDIEAGIRLD